MNEKIADALHAAEELAKDVADMKPWWAEDVERVRKAREVLDLVAAARSTPERRRCTCAMPTYYSSPEGAKGHCTCGAL